MTTTLKQFQGSVVAPEDDGKVYKFLGGVAGVVSGCTVTIYANNQLKVASGWGFACGRVFTVEEEVVVANTTAAKGRILVNIDLENVAEPAALTTQSAAVLPALVQEDINADGTVYQLALAQYDIASNTISNLTDVKVVLDDLDTRLNDTKAEIISAVYPVGSIYMSVANTSPSTLFGGTWVQLKDKFLLGAGDTYANGATGGAATHTLTEAQLPAHNHSVPLYEGHCTETGTGSLYYSRRSDLTSQPVATAIKGSGQAHNNMPPYLVVYMWKRTA